MTTEISVGPPVLTINQGNTFMVTDLNGEISAESELGVFSRDTRFLSYYAIFANGESWMRLSSSTTSYFAARIHLTNAAIPTEYGEIPQGTLALTITRQIARGIREHIHITNYGQYKAIFNLEIALRSDFADIFEVRSHKFVRRGRIDTNWEPERGELHVTYRNHDFHRSFIYRLLESNSKAHFANGRITFEMSLEPGQTWESTSLYLLDYKMQEDHEVVNWQEQAAELELLQKMWRDQATKLTSANEEIYRAYSQSVDDMGALRLHTHDLARDVWVPAAGVPWYVSLFGRDSLIVSLQNMFVHAHFAIGALKTLGDLQAKEVNDWQDAQPGKILHEIRLGELAFLKRIPHSPYYGSADSTPLYLTVVHEAWKWLGDDQILKDYRDICLSCLEWIDKYGDLDGDGFQEYKTRSSQGYENMCWKDSYDGIMYPDGTNVAQPKAVCEIQGYVFDAWMRMSEVFEVLGERATASQLRDKAKVLKQKFESAFWSDEIGSYALALDKNKKPVLSVASNPGHLLWSGIVSQEHAGCVVKRLMEPDMWSGWGIRTLSAQHQAYNPHSYHRGSVWPHDNGIIALGFKRYGFVNEAAAVARDISRAASYFVGHRIPELYAGIQREEDNFPVQYLGANVPQAWSAGSIFQLLQAITGLQADAPRQMLHVDPQLPRWLPDLSLYGMTVGDSILDLHFKRQGDKTTWDAEVKKGKLKVTHKSWQPW